MVTFNFTLTSNTLHWSLHTLQRILGQIFSSPSVGATPSVKTSFGQMIFAYVSVANIEKEK